VTAALLAAQGFGGPPDVFEGKFGAFQAWSDGEDRPELLTERLGERFFVTELAIKLYACCAFLHPGLDALLSIVNGNLVAADGVASVVLRFPRGGVQLIDDNPLRSHCGQYILPIALLERKIVVDDILHDRRSEPAIARLSEICDVVADDALHPEFPARYATVVEVETRDGRRFRERVDDARGTVANPVTAEEIEAKFGWLAGPAVGPARVERIRAEVAALERATSIAPLTALLAGDR